MIAAQVQPVPEARTKTLVGHARRSATTSGVRSALRSDEASAPAAGGEEPPAGAVVAGRYEVVDILGEGGMGSVYRAADRVIDREVALKVLTAPGREAAARFRREARSASRVSSRFVAGVHDFGEDPQYGLFMVMELLRGRTLEEVLRDEGALSTDRAIEIAARIGDALAAAHGEGIVHRDLKPANVMLTDDGGLKVLDFGIARVDARTAGRDEEELTLDGVALGTPLYISPEAACAGAVGPASDLYALGVMLFEMLAGRPPFEGERVERLLIAHAKRQPPSLTALVPGRALPLELVALVDALLDKSPARRPSSAREVSRRLRSIAASLDIGRAPRRLRLSTAGVFRWLGAGVLVALLGGGTLAGVLPRPGAPGAHSAPSKAAKPAPEPEPSVRIETASTAPTAAAPREPEPEIARVVVSTWPRHARVRLDGSLVPSPLSFPRDGESHELVVFAPGFVAERRELTADRDYQLEIVLRRRPRRQPRAQPALSLPTHIGR